MNRYSATIGICLSVLALLAAGCGGDIMDPDTTGDVDSASQAVVVPEFELSGIADGEQDDQMAVQSFVVELRFNPVDDRGQFVASTHRVDSDSVAGDDVLQPPVGVYDIELLVTGCTDDHAGAYPGCDVVSDDDGFRSHRHMMMTAGETQSGEENDGSPLPRPIKPKSSEDGDGDTGTMSSALMTESSGTPLMRTTLPGVEIGEEDLRLDIVIDGQQWESETSRATTDVLDGNIEIDDVDDIEDSHDAEDSLDESITVYEVLTVDLDDH